MFKKKTTNEMRQAQLVRAISTAIAVANSGLLDAHTKEHANTLATDAITELTMLVRIGR